MKKTLLILILIAILLLAGCAPQETQPTATIEPAFTLIPTLVVKETPEADEDLPAYLPHPGDSALTKANTMVDKVYVLYNDADPVEVLLHISGHLPTPCHQLRVAVPAPDENGDIYVEVYSLVEPDILCEQVLRAYDETINLGTYPKGSYWVYVNGGRAGNFDY